MFNFPLDYSIGLCILVLLTIAVILAILRIAPKSYIYLLRTVEVQKSCGCQSHSESTYVVIAKNEDEAVGFICKDTIPTRIVVDVIGYNSDHLPSQLINKSTKQLWRIRQNCPKGDA